MGRVVRRVPKDWEHPKDRNGDHIPLMGWSFSENLKEWEKGEAMWRKGMVSGYCGKDWEPKSSAAIECESYEDWSGGKPVEDEYMPGWKDSERTHLQMYEDCSEGTPISPIFESPEPLARWLADNGASAFGSMTATYEQWLNTIKAGSAPSAVFTPATGLVSGVEAVPNNDGTKLTVEDNE